MTCPGRPLYPWAMECDWPYERAFVLQLGKDSDPAGGRIEGRVEHVKSLRAARFGSLVELVAFLMDVLEECNSAGTEEHGEV